jgi:VanZ family protein
LAYQRLRALTILWFLFMTWLSHQDGAHTLKTSSSLANGLAKRLGFLQVNLDVLNLQLRKLAHVAVFFVLTVLFCLTLYVGRKPAWPLLFLIVWCYADERSKRWIAGRHFSWVDVGLNLLGVAAGGSVALLLCRM